MILREFLTIKNKVQNGLNTRSMSSRQVVKISIDPLGEEDGVVASCFGGMFLG